MRVGWIVSTNLSHWEHPGCAFGVCRVCSIFAGVLRLEVYLVWGMGICARLCNLIM